MIDGYRHKSGAELTVREFADGTIVTIKHHREGELAVILPPEESAKLGKYLGQGVADVKIDEQVLSLLRRVYNTYGMTIELHKGDKTLLRELLGTLRKLKRKECTYEEADQSSSGYDGAYQDCRIAFDGETRVCHAQD